jgi:hypothetical protein
LLIFAWTGIKLTFFTQKKGNRDNYSIVEVDPMYITPQKLTQMSSLDKLIDELINLVLNKQK